MATEPDIEANRGRLLVELAAMVAMLPGLDVAFVRRAVHLAVLALLRPAESATRRLIAILAHGMTVEPGPKRTMPKGGIPSGSGKRKGAPAFPLFDPRKNPKPPEGRKSAPGVGPSVIEIGVGRHVAAPAPVPVLPDDPVSARALLRRIAALEHALGDLHGQARRLARVFARGKAKWLRVMRPGRPPGHREGGKRPVDEILRDCQWFALEALREPAPP